MQESELRRRLFADIEQQVKEQQQAKQDIAEVKTTRTSTSIADIGADSGFWTPRCRQENLSSTRTPRYSEQSSRDACRFHREVKQLKPAAIVDNLSGTHAAGFPTSHVKRRDMCPDTPGSRGRARSMTPNSYRRYGSNSLGTSLPGAGDDKCPPPSPTQSTLRRVGLCDPRGSPLTASRLVVSACRYHMDAEPRGRAQPGNNAFAISSLTAKPTAALAGSLRGGGSVMRPRRSEGARSPRLWRDQ